MALETVHHDIDPSLPPENPLPKDKILIEYAGPDQGIKSDEEIAEWERERRRDARLNRNLRKPS